MVHFQITRYALTCRALPGSASNASPAVLVVGPKQCGKSTLVRASRPGWTPLDLERPADLALLDADLEEAHPKNQAGAEVDLLLVHGRRIVPVEIKLGASVDARSIVGLKRCMTDLGAKRGFVVYTGAERRMADPSVELLPWAGIAAGEVDLPL